MNVSAWLDMLLYSDQGAVSQPVTLLFTLLLAFAIGQLVGWIYLGTNTAPDYQRSFVGALVVLPVIVSLLMMLMAGSLMVAFGLLAVFAVVRFRNVLRDTRDTVFILWSIVEGMSVGTFRYSTAVLGALAIGVVLGYLRVSNFGAPRCPDGQLCVEISGDPATGRAALDRLLHRHAHRWTLAKEQSMPGQGQILTFLLHLRDRNRSLDLREELSQADHLHEVSYVPQPVPSKKDNAPY
ncbi:MAG TPA: DUF4956 domain-containing protein [Lacipirellulaceae bacterium]|nr:DUF4956 domain-containing protein [Lacipirellulaceae bacterium]